MHVMLILLFVLVFLSSIFILSKPKGLPPGPISLPMIGSYFLLRQMQKKEPYVAYFEASKIYGNIFSFKLGSQLVVVLHGYDTIHQALVKQADVFSDRPILEGFRRQFKDGLVKGIAYQKYNHQWKTLRRFALQSLRDFGVGKSSIEKKIIMEVDAASSVIETEIGIPLQISKLLQRMVGNIIYGIVFGKRFEYDDPDCGVISMLSDAATTGRGPMSVEFFFPTWMTKLFFRQTSKAQQNKKQAFKDIEKFIFKQIKEHEDSYDENNTRDFIDLYIQAVRESNEKTSEVFTTDNVIRVIMELFVAGTETTYKTLDWALLFMIENPDIQEKCQLEIENNIGEKIPESGDRAKLKYIDATISEVQRLANIGPLALPHCAKENTTLLGYHIPKNTIISPSLYSASRDPEYWREPDRFNPDRFLDGNQKLIKHEALIPFSTGPRTCLGENLARQELFIIFASLLQRFTFYRENINVRHSMASMPNEHISEPYPYKVRIQKRK